MDEPGIYAGRTEVDGEQLEMAIQVDAAEDVEVIRPGDALPPIETPTTDVRLLHADVYAKPHDERPPATKTAVIDELHLAFEPCLVLVDADGQVVERIDTIYDQDEVDEALSRLTASRR